MTISNGLTKKNIVIIGGGGRSAWLLGGLKKYADKYNFAVIGSIADDGGSTGKLRKDLDVSGLGALRKCLLALSEANNDVKNVFAYRFEKGELTGHVAGNIFMTALEKTSGSAARALESAHKLLKVNGRIIPASFDKVTLFAELEDGQVIEGETNIDIPKHNGNLKIKRIFFNVTPKANPEALKIIADADLFIIGPGDLYTTVLPNFLVPGVAEAMKKAKVQKILIVNHWNKFGETNDFLVDDFAAETEKYLDAQLDYVIYNSGTCSRKKQEEQKKIKPMLTCMVKSGKDLNKNKFIGKDMLEQGESKVDVAKLAKIIIDIANF